MKIQAEPLSHQGTIQNNRLPGKNRLLTSKYKARPKSSRAYIPNNKNQGISRMTTAGSSSSTHFGVKNSAFKSKASHVKLLAQYKDR